MEGQPTAGIEARRRSRLPGPMARWSFGLLAVAVLRLIDAAGRFAVGIGVRDLPVSGVPVVNSIPEAARVADIALAVLTVLGVVGLLLYQRWGWVLTMVIVGVELLLGLIRVWVGLPDYLTLALMVVATFYLNQHSVRAMVNEDAVPDHDSPPSAR